MDVVKNFKALAPHFEFSKATKAVHRYTGGIREILLVSAQTLRTSPYGPYAEAGKLTLSYLSYSGMSALLVIARYVISLREVAF